MMGEGGGLQIRVFSVGRKCIIASILNIDLTETFPRGQIKDK